MSKIMYVVLAIAIIISVMPVVEVQAGGPPPNQPQYQYRNASLPWQAQTYATRPAYGSDVIQWANGIGQNHVSRINNPSLPSGAAPWLQRTYDAGLNIIRNAR